MDDLISDDFINSIMDEIESAKKSQISITEEGEYITFHLAGETYGISVLKVKEIIKIMPITPLLDHSDGLIGVVNLRDHVIPVFDLRSLLGLEKCDYNDETCIIIIEIWYELKLKQFGIIIDAISGVLKIDENDLVEVPEILAKMDVSYLVGMVKYEDRVILLLNTDNIVRKLN